MNLCATCNSSEAGAVCSKCKNIYYCGRECQTSDWTRHKIECRGMTQKKYFLKSSWIASDVKCGYGCFCNICTVQIEPLKVLFSHGSDDGNQKQYLEKMLKTACDEIKDIKFEFGTVPCVTDKELGFQVGSSAIFISDFCAMTKEFFKSPDTIETNNVVDPTVINKVRGLKCILFAYNTARLPRGACFGAGMVEFYANDETLQKCRENRKLIRTFQNIFVKHIESRLSAIADVVADLSPSLVFGLLHTVVHPAFDDKEFQYIVISISLTDQSIEKLEIAISSIKNGHVSFIDHFPTGITCPHAHCDQGKEGSVGCVNTLSLKLSTQMIKYYWTEAAVKDIPPAEPMQFYAVRSTKSHEIVMFDENVLFLFPKTGNEDFEMPGMAGCVRRGGFVQVPIF